MLNNMTSRLLPGCERKLDLMDPPLLVWGDETGGEVSTSRAVVLNISEVFNRFNTLRVSIEV